MPARTLAASTARNARGLALAFGLSWPSVVAEVRGAVGGAGLALGGDVGLLDATKSDRPSLEGRIT